ncbi:MAG: cyclic nucleotide-binding domain-containing protein [Salinivirgaceae bacterium]|jgi:CRP-like cAMP-binding protein|nr:cyclic nucleotide-binding domain-containing protein [Salinivirgaceae bacterium]
MIDQIQKEFSPWFDNLSEELLQKVAENQVNLTYNKGEILCKQGGFASHMFFLTHGLIKTYKEHNDKNLILKIMTIRFFTPKIVNHFDPHFLLKYGNVQITKLLPKFDLYCLK